MAYKWMGKKQRMLEARKYSEEASSECREKKLKCDFLLNFNMNDQTQNFRNIKIEREKKKKSLNLKKKSVLGNIYVHFFPYEIFSENFDIT